MKEKLRQKNHMSGLLALLLFGVFAVCILSVLLMGADAYQHLTERDDASYDRRTAAQYIAAKVRQADTLGRVFPGSFDDSDPDAQSTLFLTEEIDGETYATRIYYYDGYIRELFGRADESFAKADGEKVLEAGDFHASWGMDQRELRISLRDAREQGADLVLTLRSGEGAAE